MFDDFDADGDCWDDEDDFDDYDEDPCDGDEYEDDEYDEEVAQEPLRLPVAGFVPMAGAPGFAPRFVVFSPHPLPGSHGGFGSYEDFGSYDDFGPYGESGPYDDFDEVDLFPEPEPSGGFVQGPGVGFQPFAPFPPLY